MIPDGEIVQLTGPNDYLLTLVGLATHREDATPQQAAHLDLIQKCVGSREPGGSLLNLDSADSQAVNPLASQGPAVKNTYRYSHISGGYAGRVPRISHRYSATWN